MIGIVFAVRVILPLALLHWLALLPVTNGLGLAGAQVGRFGNGLELQLFRCAEGF